MLAPGFSLEAGRVVEEISAIVQGRVGLSTHDREEGTDFLTCVY